MLNGVLLRSLIGSPRARSYSPNTKGGSRPVLFCNAGSQFARTSELPSRFSKKSLNETPYYKLPAANCPRDRGAGLVKLSSFYDAQERLNVYREETKKVMSTEC